MKRIEKELLLLELENANMGVERKYKKLDTIITYFLDEEELDPVKDEAKKEEETKKENEHKEENKKEDKTDENSTEESKVDEQTEEIEELPRESKEDLLPQDIKTIYRKIMMKTHPDKTKGKVFEEEYEDYYKKAVVAKNENDKAEILYIAYKLDVKEVFEVDEEHFGNVKYKIKTLEMKSTQLDNNPFWIWYHTDNQALKNIMIQQIAKMRSGKKR